MSKSFAQFKEVVKSRSTIYDLDNQKRKVETPSQRSGIVTMDHLVPPRPKITRKKPTTASPNETLTSDSTIKANGNEKPNSIQSNSSQTYSHYTPNEKSHASTKESDNNHRSETQSVSGTISADPAWAAESTSFNHTSSKQKTQQSPNHRQPRSREQTIDSIQFTKRMPGAGSFEDIKSEAINSWGEGVDLELESGARAKKRADWLAPGDFFASTTDSSNSSESHIKNDISVPASMHPTDEQQSYASAAKQKTPAWAIENSTMSFDTHTASFTQTTEWRTNNQLHHISPQVPHMAPLVVMPSGYPYLPITNGFAANPNSSNPAAVTAALMVPSLPDGIAHPNSMMLHDERDMESGLYLISFLENHDQKSTLIEFQKKVGHLLHHRLPEFSMRNFSLLVDVLAIAMEHEIHHKAHVETARKIKEVWGLFKARLIHYTQAYAYMPTELEGLLQFSMALSYHEPKLAPELPVSDYLSMYQRMSKSIASDTRENILKYLYKLKTISASDKSVDNLWDDAPSQDLPLIPNASLVITEVSEQVNLLKGYQDQHGTIITNQTNSAWSDNISDYFVTQFLLLREEMIGPAKKVMNNLFRESSDQHYSEYQHASPKALTLLASSSEPAVVFQLGHVHTTDNPMLDFQEGYLVFLLPERDLTSKSQRRPSIKSVADKALMGQAIRASMRHNALGQPLRIVSIHINKNDLPKLNWSKRYTLITSPINAASTLSTLEWLYESCYNLDIKKFSFVLTPRLIAATNILSPEQMKAWEERYANSAIESNADAIPDYIGDAEIDVSCIMTRTNTSHRACPGTDSWPSHPPQVRDISSKLPSLYCLSPSQLKSVKFALTHRIAIISGAPGTGKTFLASKLAQLLSNALTAGQFHQPVLVIAKSQSSLDDILSNVVSAIPNIVRFGGELHKDNLIEKQITRQATLSVSDPNYRQHQHLERQLARNQAHLNALLNLRAQISDHDPSILSTSIPPSHRQMLEKGFVKTYGASSYISDIAIWSSWASHDKKSKTFDSVAKPRHSFFKSLQWQMESAYVKRAGRGLLPLMDQHLVKNRFANVANMSFPILPITSATRWPFESSENQSGPHIRTALMNEWKKVPADCIWTISEEEKTKLIEGLVSVMISFIDKEIQHVMQEQVKAAQAHDDNLIQKWLSLCRFNRIIGMTADFASAHREFLANLWPRSVIVDEASEILESTVSSIVLGPRTEHVILLGTSDCLKKPRINNDALAGEPHQLDISLFERWKLTNIEKAHLEEQWRMHSEIARVVSQFNARKKNGANSLLITAPLASRDENLVDGKRPAKEVLYGITQRALYVHYKPHEYTQRDDHFAHAYYSRMLMTEVTNAQVDEARFVASFGTYLSQQPYPSPDIAILTISNLQKSLITAILKEEIPKRTCFVSNIKNIAVETVDQYLGRQNSFTILSTATPGHYRNTIDNVSHALTRAKYGLFVVGQPDVDQVHPQWKEFAKYMQECGLYSHSICLTCHTHGDTINAKHWKDFLMMKNGGCQNPCGTLMNDGHVCKEECHFLSHSEVICREPCNRLRPTGCAHACRRKCYECSKEGICPPCTEETEVVLPCGHKQVNLCHRLQGNQNNRQQVKCHEIVKVELPCGHTKQIECYQAHQKNVDKLKCDVKQSVTLACGHTAMSHCGVETICAEPCKESLECGHKCKELCGMLHSHSRSECAASCPKQLICGHMCAKGCANPDQHTERCIEKCNYTCSHGYKCSRECYKDCIRCISECPYRCAHYKCTKKCFEICDRPPCEAPCRIKLSCGHKCSGLCGENCPPCMICEKQLKCSITLRHLYEFEKDEKIYQLPECGCVFAVEALDAYFETQAKNGEHTAIKLWQCPECQKPIYTALRYSKYIKIEIALVNAIKIRMEKDRQKLTHHEREQIINAMNDETRHHRVYNIVGGRWFVCENQHPYYVGDCGGATEISKCPECDAPIGGTKHRVVESNRFYGEFDGSEKPAWPAQPGASSEG